MKFLRTLRFDSSDERVFPSAAATDEWAVSGAFAFADLRPVDLTGKTRQAFANGFLSVESFGRATFTTVTGMTDTAHTDIIEKLCAHLTDCYGAPSTDAARPAANEEIAFITDLCANLHFGTVLAVQRHFDDSGRIREEFRVIDRATNCVHERAWEISEE